MTTKKQQGRKRGTAHDAAHDTPTTATDTMTAEELAAQSESPAAKRAAEREARKSPPRAVPTYKTDHEVAAARAMYGSDYEKMIASGSIIAPTVKELPHEVLAARIAKKDAKAEQDEA